MQFENTASVSYEVLEGDEITVGCLTNQPAYYTALEFHHPPVSSFFVAPNGKTITQEGQIFVLRNVTQRNSGNYSCMVKDKNLRNTEIQVATVIVKSRMYRKRELQLVCSFGLFCFGLFFVCLFSFVLFYFLGHNHQINLFTRDFQQAKNPGNEVVIKIPQRRASQLGSPHPSDPRSPGFLICKGLQPDAP